MKYNNHLNYRDRKRLLLKLRIVSAIVSLVFVGGSLFFYFKYMVDKNGDKPSAVSSSTASVVASSINIFKSPYFQFQAPDSWVELPNLSSANKFVYRSLRSNLIEHELTIYVGQVPANLEANRVMPVEFSNNKMELIPENVSDHCMKELKGQTSSQPIAATIDGVKTLCDADSTNYTVLVGQKNEDTLLSMIRPNGAPVAYTIYYSNLRAIPDAVMLKQIMETFQTR